MYDFFISFLVFLILVFLLLPAFVLCSSSLRRTLVRYQFHSTSAFSVKGVTNFGYTSTLASTIF